MPKLSENKVPSYRFHKSSGQAIVTLCGQDILLGRFNSADSKAEYTRRIAEWISAGRQRPVSTADLSIAELMARYRVHCESYYRHRDGTPTGETDNIRKALRPLRQLYGDTPASEFSPLKLKAVREAMIDPKLIDSRATRLGWCRGLVNRQCGKIRGMFKWAVENELVPPSVYHGLTAVSGLKHGRTLARESKLVMPVDDAIVEATLPYLTTVVASMVRVQRFTGARPGEIAGMRTVDIDTTGTIWVYQPPQHKTAHHGRHRTIAIGPRAQSVLQTFLKPLNPTAYIFNPAESTAEVRERRNAQRKTPAGRGNGIGTNRKRSPRRQPHDRYLSGAYRKAIARACDLAFRVPDDLDSKDHAAWKRSHRWHPNQLRHSAATEIRRRFGLEGAQTVLGHSSADVTQVYAERDQAAAVRIAAEVG